MRRHHHPAGQMPLPLDPDPGELTEQALRVAHQRARLRQPFESAMENPALAICIKRTALALMRRKQ
ncbi:hypothetical protein [Chromobacterium violaceum]|uniref:hypothetical protein n=1 Tax=Chromobacterium violaceum TaxID=536 RepID=UPI0015F8878F|nr:hypothetical protein [Chromobacterium violaceum]MBA8735361.1 hypothetical protein [Chromobacterium violaceum]